MAVPAELMALLQGGGDAGAPAPQAAPAAPEQGGGLYGAGGNDGQEALRAALDALQAYAQSEDDDAHIQTVLKCVTALQGILAEEQKMSDGLMAGKADARSLRRATAAEGPQY